MKLLIINLLSTLIMATAGVAVAQQSDGERMSDELLQLIYRGHDLRDPEQIRLWHSELQTKPGLVDELWNRLWPIVDGKEDGDPEVFCYALAQRADLTKEQEKTLIDRLDLLTNSDLPKRASLEFQTTLGLLFVLERGKDPRSEAIAIRLLNSQNPDAMFCVPGGLRTMKKSGGTASLEAIRAYVKRRFGDKPEKVFEYGEFADAENAIKGRVDAAKSGSGTASMQASQTVAQRSTPMVGSTGQPLERFDQPTPWLVWGVMIVGVIALLWRVLKKRK